MTVSHGADAERLGAIVGELRQLSHTTGTIGLRGTQMLTVLAEAWQGPDVEAFASDWDLARQQLDASSGLLERMGADLARQAGDQTAASAGATSRAGGGGAADGPELEDERNHFQRFRDNLTGRSAVRDVPDDEAPVDPGEGNVDLPEGADPDEKAIKEMLETPRGRATLQYLADNDISIRFDDDVKGAYYSPAHDVMVLGKGYQGADTIIHEASHAEWDVEGEAGDAQEMGRQEYVDTQLDNETEACVEEIYYAKERRMSGESVGRDGMERAYDKAYTEAIEDGESEDAADDAGRAAVRKRFEDGEVVTSTDGKTYPEYYEDGWRKAN